MQYGLEAKTLIWKSLSFSFSFIDFSNTSKSVNWTILTVCVETDVDRPVCLAESDIVYWRPAISCQLLLTSCGVIVNIVTPSSPHHSTQPTTHNQLLTMEIEIEMERMRKVMYYRFSLLNVIIWFCNFKLFLKDLHISLKLKTWLALVVLGRLFTCFGSKIIQYFTFKVENGNSSKLFHSLRSSLRLCDLYFFLSRTTLVQ